MTEKKLFFTLTLKNNWSKSFLEKIKALKDFRSVVLSKFHSFTSIILNQKEFRVEKVVKRQGDKLYDK